MHRLWQQYEREKRAADGWSRLTPAERLALPKTADGHSVLEFKGHRYAVGFVGALHLPIIRELDE